MSLFKQQPNNGNASQSLKTIEEAILMVQVAFTDTERLGEEKAARNRAFAEDAIAGVKGAKEKVIGLLLDFFKENNLEIEGIELHAAVNEIYKELWGLGPLEEVYGDPAVNELQINAPDKVFVLRNLKLEKLDVKFRDNDHVMSLVTRMVMHDRGVGLNRSSPTIESMRKDGARITATCPPVTKHVTVAIRKHMQRVVPFEEMVERGIMDKNGADILKLLVRGRTNIAVIGGVGSGKTTTVRTMCGEIDTAARILAIETDSELNLNYHYPGRNTVEMEEHPETGRTLKLLFRTILRYSPVIIIVGEFRGEGEASEAIQACQRGHDGSMTTAHFNSPELFVTGTAKMLIREGLRLPETVAEEMVATAFNVVVKMFGDTTRGIMKLESITELLPGRPFSCRELYKWQHEEGDYSKGEWRLVGRPSEALIKRLSKYGIPETAVDEVFKIL